MGIICLYALLDFTHPTKMYVSSKRYPVSNKVGKKLLHIWITQLWTPFDINRICWVQEPILNRLSITWLGIRNNIEFYFFTKQNMSCLIVTVQYSLLAWTGAMPMMVGQVSIAFHLYVFPQILNCYIEMIMLL